MARAGPPFLVLAVGVLVAAALWRDLRASEHRQMTALLESVAAGTRAAVGARLRAQAVAVREMAVLWPRYYGPRAGEWREEALLMTEQWPEFERLLWLDQTQGAVWVAERGGDGVALSAAERKALAPLIEAARKADAFALIGPEETKDAVYYHLLAPLAARAGNPRPGCLIATSRLDTALESIHRPLADRFRIRTLWNGREVLRTGAARAAEDAPERGASVTLPGGGELEVRVAPGAPIARAVTGLTPDYVLAIGSVTAFLLASLLVAYRALRERASALERAQDEARAEAAHARAAERQAFGLAVELEGRVAARTQQLADAVEELEAFNYSVSHDLRSPLGAIVNLSAILEEDHGAAIGDDGILLVRRIARSAAAATSMMDGLVELSRLGRATLASDLVDMEALARESMQEARAALDEERPVRFELGALPRAHGDAALLRLVFSNLLSNALKYTREREKPRIAVTGHGDGRELVYCVTDNGVGFDMRYVDRLFRPFQRLHSPGAYPGSGIGLAIVARAIGRHGGRVWAEGEVDRGSSFCFSLPARPPEGDAP
jgi:signal transduction histidine kinase